MPTILTAVTLEKLQIIPINDNYRIASDSLQWMIQKPRNRKGEVVWESCSFYPAFKMTVVSLGERMVRESDAAGIVEGMEAVENVCTMLSRLIPEIQVEVMEEC